MKYTRNIFAVSFIALLSVATARAEVVSTELLDKRLGTEGNLATVAHTGSYNDLANKPTIPTVNNATLTVQKNGTTVDTFTANASANKTINITVPTNTKELTNGAGFITSADISGKVNTDQKAGNANKAMITNAQGFVTPGTITSAMITDGTITNDDIATNAAIAKGKLASDVQKSLGRADSALQAVPVASATTLGGVKAGANITITDGVISTHAPVVPGDGTLTIKQGTTTKTFTANQSGNVEVVLTDNDTKYTQGTNVTITGDNNAINVATANGNTLGVVKAGTNVSISSGVVSVATATPTTLGVAKVGQIPSGSATSTTYATIWVE